MTGDGRLDGLLGEVEVIERRATETRKLTGSLSTKDMRVVLAELDLRRQEVWGKIRRRKVDLQAEMNGYKIMRPSSKTGLRRAKWG